MIVRATSDLHLSETTAPLVFAALKVLRADARDGGLTVLCGDIFDQGVSIHMPTWNRLRTVLHNWPDRVYVIAGNHDQYPGGNCLYGLDGGSCRVVSIPLWTRIGRMVPYFAPDRFAAACQVPGGTDADHRVPMVWAHQGFRGAYMNAMRRDRDGVAFNDVPDRHMVVTGHYHMPQAIGHVIYCGSPYQTSFAEEGQTKGWLRWSDIFADLMPTRIAYDLKAPKHHTVRWDGEGDPPTLPDWVSDSDKVRIVTSMSRAALSDRASALERAGLQGAPVVSRAELSRAPDVANLAPREAVLRWLYDHADRNDPGAMELYAEQEGLWPS